MTAFKSRFDTYKDCVGNQRGAIVCVTLAVILGACSSPNNIRIPAPVIDHSPNKTDSRESSRESSPRVANPQVSTANLESSNKPGYYTVKPGDTIYHISLDNGQNWKDLARWNNLENPNMIEVGKVLRVLPPESNVSTEGVVVRPVGSQNNPTTSTGSLTVVSASPVAPVAAVAPAVSAANAVSGVPGALPAPTVNAVSSAAPSPATLPAPPPRTAPSAVDNSSEIPTFIWPSSGKVIANFDEAKNKGIDIGGKAGEPVLAAADGKVVYAGAGLRGYGNLIIIKHNNTYLTAYAHNQTLVAKEDQMVKVGQKIAELGSSESEQPLVHFEIRKLGKPVDPLKWLPAR
jgi:lipoprotein NlpD